MCLITKDKTPNKLVNLKLQHSGDKPLVILFTWLMAKHKHVQKFVDIYLKEDFDVLRISVTPWQLLWPTKGSQLVATEVLKFLENNYIDRPCILHGFSVGGYLWSEAMVQMSSEKERYKPVIDKIVGQIWDSAADITELPIGVPTAVFPRNPKMQNALSQYIIYHLKTFDKVATRHYVRASQMFHTNLIRSPALVFVSKTDPIGAIKSNLQAKESWEGMDMKVIWQCWDESPHVGHFQKHKDEYIAVWMKFLEDIGLRNHQQKIAVEAKL